MMRVLACVMIMLTLNACALTVDEVDLAYQPQSNVVPVGGAESVRVTVNTADGRTANRDRISVKKNGYGMEMAAIVAKQEVPKVVGAAIEQELKARGFQIAAGKVFVLAEVNKFYNDFKIGFFAGDGGGEVMLSVQVLNADGRSFYAKVYSGEYMEETIFLASGQNAKLAVEGALRVAIARMMDDPYLIQAIIEANRAMQAGNSGAPTS